LRLSSLLDGRAKLDAELGPQGAASVRSGPRSLREIEGDLFVAIFERGTAQQDGAAPTPLVVAAVDLDTLLRRAGFPPATPSGMAVAVGWPPPLSAKQSQSRAWATATVVGSDGTTSYTSRDGTPITSRYRHDP